MQYALETNETNAPDGTYTAKANMTNHFKGNGTKCDFESQTQVIVSGGLLHTKSLLEAAEEIRAQSGYWGMYVEAANYNAELQTIEIQLTS